MSWWAYCRQGHHLEDTDGQAFYLFWILRNIGVLCISILLYLQQAHSNLYCQMDGLQR
jgi:hypothetical protein